MAIYLQLGQGSTGLLDDAAPLGFTGAILSPVNSDKQEVSKQIAKTHKYAGFRTIFDPQLYYPRTRRGKLAGWGYFPKEFDTADTSSEVWWSKLIDNYVQQCDDLRVGAACSPAKVPLSFATDYYALMVRVGDLLSQRLEGTHIKPILTVVADFADLTPENRVHSIASIISKTKIDEIFLVLKDDSNPRKELASDEALKAAMRLIYDLEQADLRVTVGFCSSEVLLWKYAGATACSTGKHFSLRRFTPSRWGNDTEEDSPIQHPYWFEESLMAFLLEPDLIRLEKTGLISEASKRNPFCQQISRQIEKSPGEPWLKLSWLQFLAWFSDVERRYDDGEIELFDFLQNADENWKTVVRERIIFMDRFNDGIWLRKWLQAAAEFDR